MKFVINFLASIMLSIQSYAQAIVEFKQQISIDAHYLGDLVQIEHDDQQWTKIPLDSHPRAGELINKKQIMNWLTQKSGKIDYSWKGKHTIRVQSPIRSTGEELVAKAQAELKHYLSIHYKSAEIATQSKLKNSVFALSDFTVEIPSKNPPSRHICVRLNHNKHSIPVWFNIKVFEDVMIAKKPLKKNTLVNTTDLILKRCDITGLGAEPYTYLSEIRWLKKSINKDAILTKNLLSSPPQVIKGQTVRIQIANHGISINTEAVAQSNGYKGQFVRMKNPQSSKYFTARIIAAGRAEILS